MLLFCCCTALELTVRNTLYICIDASAYTDFCDYSSYRLSPGLMGWLIKSTSALTCSKRHVSLNAVDSTTATSASQSGMGNAGRKFARNVEKKTSDTLKICH